VLTTCCPNVLSRPIPSTFTVSLMNTSYKAERSAARVADSSTEPTGRHMGETFLGGFAGGFLEKGFHVGYGLYFTTTRLIGIDLGSHGGGALGGTLAGFIKGELMPNLSPEESAKVIQDLNRIKEFDIGRDQIRLIELKKPGLGVGRMTITPNDGATITIKLRHRTAYDRLVQLTHAFSPEVVRSSKRIGSPMHKADVRPRRALGGREKPDVIAHRP
jgi:hypothetical protein